MISLVITTIIVIITASQCIHVSYNLGVSQTCNTAGRRVKNNGSGGGVVPDATPALNNEQPPPKTAGRGGTAPSFSCTARTRKATHPPSPARHTPPPPPAPPDPAQLQPTHWPSGHMPTRCVGELRPRHDIVPNDGRQSTRGNDT